MDEAPVPVQALIDGQGAHRAEGWSSVTYHHVLCDDHVVLLAEGVQAESLLLGPQALVGLGLDMPSESEALFPSVPLAWRTASRMPCLPLLTCREGGVLSQTARDLATMRAVG